MIFFFVASIRSQVPQQDSPRNHVLPEAELAADAGPIVWPGAEAEADGIWDPGHLEVAKICQNPWGDVGNMFLCNYETL